MINYYFLILFLFFVFGCVVNSDKFLFLKSTNWLRSLFFSVPIFFLGLVLIGLRPLDAGGDTVSYLNAYDRVVSILTARSDAAYGSEILFWPAQAILKLLFKPREWLIVNYIMVFSLGYFSYKFIVKNSDFNAVIFVLVFLTYYCVYSGNAMRQAYAVPIGVISFCLFYEKRYILSFLSCLIAASFHWSSIVFLFSFVFLFVPNRGAMYVLLPIVALFSSVVSPVVMEIFSNYFGFDWLTKKINLYFFGGRDSHIESIFKTINFWLCAFTYFSLLFFGIYRERGGEVLVKLYSMFFSITLFFIKSPDVAERYMVWLIFVFPLSWVFIICRFKIHTALRNFIVLFVFLGLGFMTLTRDSSKLTLGLLG